MKQRGVSYRKMPVPIIVGHIPKHFFIPKKKKRGGGGGGKRKTIKQTKKKKKKNQEKKNPQKTQPTNQTKKLSTHFQIMNLFRTDFSFWQYGKLA